MKTLPAVVVGDFPSAEAARAAIAGECLARYWVLPADRFGGSGTRLVLAMLAGDRRMAGAEMARVCEGAPMRRVAEFHPSPGLR